MSAETKILKFDSEEQAVQFAYDAGQHFGEMYFDIAHSLEVFTALHGDKYSKAFIEGYDSVTDDDEDDEYDETVTDGGVYKP